MQGRISTSPFLNQNLAYFMAEHRDHDFECEWNLICGFIISRNLDTASDIQFVSKCVPIPKCFELMLLESIYARFSGRLAFGVLENYW